MNRKHKALSLMLCASIVSPLWQPCADAQPPVTQLPITSTKPDAAADAVEYEKTVQRVKLLGPRNPQQAVAEWQQLLEARPNMVPMVDYKAAFSLGSLLANSLDDANGAIAVYDASLKKAPMSPGSLVLAGDKGRLLMKQGRIDEAEATMQPYWQRALNLYREDGSVAQTLSRFLMKSYIEALDRQTKTDEIITRLQGAMIEVPALLSANAQGDAWIYQTLNNKLLAKKQYAEALSWARVRFMTADYGWQDMSNAVQTLTQIWQAAEGAASPSLQAFMEASDDPTKPNPLAAVPLPAMTPEQKNALLTGQFSVFDNAHALLLAGEPDKALVMAFRFASFGPRRLGVVLFICRTAKAIDLNTVRANAFIKYVESGAGENPLEAQLRKAGFVPPPLDGAAPEEVDLRAFGDLKAEMAEKKADGNTLIDEYTRFLTARPKLEPKVGIEVTDAIGQVHVQQLRNTPKAMETYGEGYQRYNRHPNGLRLVIAERKLSGVDAVPQPIQIRKLLKKPDTIIASTGTGTGTGTSTGTPPTATGPAPNPQPVAPAAEASLVTNTKDSGPGSLRQALIHAGSNPGSTIRFNIPVTDPGFRNGVFTITPLSPLPAVKGARTIIDGSTQSAFTGDTNKSGPEIELQSSAGTRGRHGFYLNASDCVLKSLIINSHYGTAFRNGIVITGPGATGNKVVGCYIGVDPTGKLPMINAFGVQIESGANGNIIGGTTLDARNVIAGNECQIFLTGKDTSGNIIQGNYLGTDAGGEKVFPNSVAVVISLGASKNKIGGTAAGAGNLIVAEGERASGIRIENKGSNGNIIQGNLIGTDRIGTKVVAAMNDAIFLNGGVDGTVIGGSEPGAGNLIVGGKANGINISFCSNAVVQGNYIGLDVTGRTTLGNGHGIMVYATTGSLIGGAVPAAANIIGGNRLGGVVLLGDDAVAASTGNIVQGNYIGVGTDGVTPLANAGPGVRISGFANNNIVGLAADGGGAKNVIAFNRGEAITVMGEAPNLPTGNVIAGNTARDNGK